MELQTNQIFNEIQQKWSDEEEVALLAYALFEKKRIEVEERRIMRDESFSLQTFYDDNSLEGFVIEARKKLRRQSIIDEAVSALDSVKETVESVDAKISGRRAFFFAVYTGVITAIAVPALALCLLLGAKLLTGGTDFMTLLSDLFQVASTALQQGE
ncbi:hypothetical protein GFB49_04445 [Epibacterium sp. SM1979]|uniref:Uncharacterized protein n=1 Tax=Tritonibacter litoralis TaxID=2662264 RepID=A0A843YCU7_9RHOB|nr:hypothetical protein [Tritonibacter litoralis]MQQ07698.1 hypothetical protein [Tritonibacter litoralis]